MLAEVGARVAFTYRARQVDAEAVAETINTQHPASSPLVLQADLSNPEDCERVVDDTVVEFGQLDIFVANAAIWPPDAVPVADMSPDRWRNTLGTNLDSVFFGTRAALRAMSAHTRTRAHGDGWGRVVIVSSTAGQRGEAFHADYAATKGAIIAFVKSVCVEAAPKGITVNAVAPGWVDTEMSANPYGADGGTGRARIEKSIPLGHVASPEEIAGPIVFLCSDLASGMTGEIVNVNGGSVLCG